MVYLHITYNKESFQLVLLKQTVSKCNLMECNRSMQGAFDIGNKVYRNAKPQSKNKCRFALPYIKKNSKPSTHLVAQKLTYGKTISFFYRLLIDQSTHLCELEKKEDYCSDVCDIYFPTA